MALTLKAVADQELTTAQTLAGRAQTRLGVADAELRAAETAEADASALFTALSAKDADLRHQLAANAGGMPADTAALSDQVELNTVALRAQGAKASAAQRAAASAQHAFLAAGEQARTADARVAAAKQAKTAADARQKTLDDAALALAQAPLTDVKSGATVATGGPFKNADKRIDDDVPKELLDRAKKRLELNGLELARTQTAADEAAAESAKAAAAAFGLPSATAAALADLQAAERSYLSALDESRILLGAVAAIAAIAGAPPISAERRARMTSGPVFDAGKSAKVLEQKRDTAREDVLAKRTAFEQKWIAALAADADADPADDAAVKTAQADLDTVVSALELAEAALDTPAAADEPTPRELFGRWEATVPAETWSSVIALEGARATLKRLKTFDPATLATTLSTAEDVYATALKTQAKGDRTAGALEAAAADRDAAAQLAVRTNSDLSAVRGDL